VVGTTFGLVRANRAAEAEQLAKDDAVEQKRLAEEAAEQERQAKVRAAQRADGEQKAKLQAEAKRKEAERNLAFARKGNEILGSVFAGLDPTRIAESGRPLQDVLRENLGKAVKELEGSAIGDPLEVAAMQDTLGLSLLGLGEATLATQVLQKARDTRKARLGPDHPATLKSMNYLAKAHLDSRQYARAVALFDETLEKVKARLGPDHPATLEAMANLAGAYQTNSQLARAVPLFEETLAKMKAVLGPDHSDTFACMNNLAVAYRDSGRLARAVPLFEETLEKVKARLGPDHPETLIPMNNLAGAYRDSGQVARAVALFEETLEKRKARLGLDHPHTLATMNELTDAYVAGGQLARAVALCAETLEKRKARFGTDDPRTLQTREQLEFVRRLATADERYRAKRAEVGPKHIDTLLARRDLAQMYMSTNQLDAAEPILAEVLRGMNDLAPDHPIVVYTTGLLTRCLVARQRQAPDAWTTFHTMSLLGEVLLRQKKYATAERALLRGYRGMKAREKTIPKGGETRIPEALDRLIELYTATNRPDEAKKWRAERAKYPTAAPPPREKK
jgi:hypothetical protein